MDLTPHARDPLKSKRAISATIPEDAAEVGRILAQPDLRTASGYRDRVILEVLYSSVIRREEAQKTDKAPSEAPVVTENEAVYPL